MHAKYAKTLNKVTPCTCAWKWLIMWLFGGHLEKSGHFGRNLIGLISNINKYTKLYLSAKFHTFCSKCTIISWNGCTKTKLTITYNIIFIYESNNLALNNFSKIFDNCGRIDARQRSPDLHKGGRIFFYVSHLHGPIKQGRSVEIK